MYPAGLIQPFGHSDRFRSLAANIRNWCVALVVRLTRTRCFPLETSRTRPIRPSGIRTQSPTRNDRAMINSPLFGTSGR